MRIGAPVSERSITRQGNPSCPKEIDPPPSACRRSAPRRSVASLIKTSSSAFAEHPRMEKTVYHPSRRAQVAPPRTRFARGGVRSTRAQGRREEAYLLYADDRRTEHVARWPLIARNANGAGLSSRWRSGFVGEG